MPEIFIFEKKNKADKKSAECQLFLNPPVLRKRKQRDAG
jgi:hypothetical protein